MGMRVLVTGNGKSGSYKVRAEQLGIAIGATVSAQPASVKGFDALVLVKRPQNPALHMALRDGVPVIYDIVDAWQQQLQDDCGRPRAMRWLEQQIAIVRPAGIVAATEAMASDVREVFGGPVLALPHHARPGQAVNPVREQVATIGYEGAERYLGWWRPFLEDEAGRRGWTFRLNPPQLADLDIVVAVREDIGYPTKHWKSNVKLANAQATGTPIVCNPERGYQETAGGHCAYANDAYEMAIALDDLTPHAARVKYAEALRANVPTLDYVAARYKEWLCTSKF